ncbi:MAG: hypothetical protein HUU41_04760 [Bryobacteraceae bacterium]|nr:hypothetical protein [Bryobacterales bacterium]MEB2359957.1 hypothetical protein [Bryobacterales bacterium]NUN00402.1 hypothetical protein [Bryobacteraceae bacterium]
MLRVSILLTISFGAFAQRIVVREAPAVTMPGQVDSNSPAFWRKGALRLFNSTGNGPVLSSGPDQFSFYRSIRSRLARQRPWPMWIESVWADPGGLVLAWYHQEQENICGAQRPAQPSIGALISYDGGETFIDQGIVLSSFDAPDCSSRNGYISGGHGDFSVVLDRQRKYFYFLFTNYGGPRETQGVAIARMAYENRFRPVNAVWKYSDGSWGQPGLGGRVTPVFAARVNWQVENTDSYWGPAIHWNTYLGTWVVLLNRSCCTAGFPQEGIYAAFNPDLANPHTWTRPKKILRNTGWYPQIIGTGPGESDTIAGRVARLYVFGQSNWELVFFKARPPLPVPPPPAN